MSDDQDAPLLRHFLLNSSLSPAMMREFAESLADISPPPTDTPRFRYAPAPLQLERPNDAMARLLNQRESLREFADTPVSLTELGHLCSALAAPADGRRPWGSAGGRNPIECFVLAHRVAGLDRAVFHHDAEAHTLTSVAALPAWQELRDILNPYPMAGEPALVVVVVAVVGRTTSRYGERGGRFVLIEAGEVLQNLALRASASGLGGVILGGVLDGEMLALLDLTGWDVSVAGAFACGTPPGVERKR